jgi:hypothetical protein
VLLNPLPYADSDGIVYVTLTNPRAQFGRG